MGRIVMAVITLAIVGYLGYRSMYGRMPGTDGTGTPKQRLDNVRGAANRIEDQQQKAADEALKKAEHPEAP
jgi:hypothetical protein